MRYVPALDGVRAFAVIIVVTHHVFDGYPFGGFIGVDVFFVLSGFLITRLFVIEWETTGTIHLRKFFTRRLLRLMPALLVMVISILILVPITRGTYEIQVEALEALSAVTYTTNLWLGIFLPPTIEIFDNAWSLAVEEQFYIFWGIGAFVLLTVGSHRVTAIVLSVSAVLVYAWRCHLFLTGAAPMRIYVGFDTRADELLIGCLAAVLLPTRFAAMRYTGLAAMFALVVIVFRSRVYYISGTAALLNFSYIMTAVPFLTVLVIFDLMTNTQGLLSKTLSFRPLVYVGSISYGIYLWHWPLLVMAKEVGVETFTAKFAISGFGSFLAAALSYRYIERPALDLKRRLSSRP